MAQLPDDIFTVSSSTALTIAENLVFLLSTVVSNLPEAELREIRDALEHTIHVADDLLFNMTVSSSFDTLALNDGLYK